MSRKNNGVLFGRAIRKWFTYAAGYLPLAYLALLCAPAFKNGLFGVISGRVALFSGGITVKWCRFSLPALALSLVLYFAVVYSVDSAGRKTRKNIERGSAEWGSISGMKKKYSSETYRDNIIFTRNMAMDTDTVRHGRNLNVLVVGGSGSGKTRTYAIPNIMQANSSYVVVDPKGEIIKNTRSLLTDRGYDIKVLDLVDMSSSLCYDPFVYLENDNDIQKLATNLFENTTPKDLKNSDPFWDKTAEMLLLSLMFYLHYEADESEQNFPMILEMLRNGYVSETSDKIRSPLDMLFDELERKEPNHIAVRYYRNYRSASAKTLKSIQITLMSHLEKFDLESLSSISCTDEMDLDSLGEKKTALFCIIPEYDTSFNFMVGMLYTQIFQRLYYSADRKYGGKLPVHVHLVMDEFANTALPSGFDKILSTMRSRGISVSIIIQNMAQLKALFQKNWESISGNCDEFLYLGGNEQSTHKYISEMLGKETIDVESRTISSRLSSSSSTGWQKSARALMESDEVRTLDNRYALLFIRGEAPLKDRKYDIRDHPAYRYTLLNNEDSVRIRPSGSITFEEKSEERAEELKIVGHGRYEIISGDDLQDAVQ